MKKYTVLFVLFVLPIVAYLFFASGVNNFTKLPTVTSNIPELGEWKSLSGDTVKLEKKITVLGFSGYDVFKNRGNLFNLTSKIYERYHKFTDLQFVYICPQGTEADVQKIVKSLSSFADMDRYKFVFAKPEEISTYFDQLKLQGHLNSDFGTSNVYIVDKERNLRGRKTNDPKEYKEGYDTFHPSDLTNSMLDDFKVILYEYRAALKKNHNAQKHL